jgi:hypothetical protein
MKHEDIASILQRMPDPLAVNTLYKAALTIDPYLEWDENHALATKCIYALGTIATDEAKAKSELLAKSDNAIIREDAEQLLEDISWKPR